MIPLTHNEESITVQLERLLNDHVGGTRRAYWINDFESVARGAKVVTSDGRIEKAPDLHFRPPVYGTVESRSDWGWFVECKIVDKGHYLEAYCTDGVRRFSIGEYGARMPSSGMVGYVRDGQRPFVSLDPKLAGRFATVSHTHGTADNLSVSLHRRSELTPPCVNIELTHIWLLAE